MNEDEKDKIENMDESDKKHQYYSAGYLAGKEHRVSSPETKQFMNNINMEVKFIKEKLAKMPTKDEMLLANEKLVERIFKEVKENYTTKSEFELTITPMKRIVYGAVGLILVIVLSAVIYTVVT